MKITIVQGAFLPVPPVMGGAVEKGWFALAQEFARRGHDVTQVSRRIPDFSEREIIAGVTHIRVLGFDAPRSLLWLKFLDLLYSRRVKSVLPPADIIVTHTFWLPFLLRDSTRGQIYVHVARYPKGQLRFYRHGARLQTPSQAIARAIAAEVPHLKSKIAVIPYPRPQNVTDAVPPPIAERPKTILFVGRVHPEKGVHLLLEAFVGKLKEFAGWELLIIGPTESRHGGGGAYYLERLQRIAQKAEGQVELRGPVFDSSVLEREFRAARLFVYPSLAERGETFGLALLEAMAHGCAALVSNLECFHDFIREDDTGFFFDHRAANPAQTLGQKMAGLIANESLLARVADAGYQKSAAFSLGDVAARFLQDFASIQRMK